jgi:hypothetical protein
MSPVGLWISLTGAIKPVEGAGKPQGKPFAAPPLCVGSDLDISF